MGPPASAQFWDSQISRGESAEHWPEEMWVSKSGRVLSIWNSAALRVSPDGGRNFVVALGPLRNSCCWDGTKFGENASGLYAFVPRARNYGISSVLVSTTEGLTWDELDFKPRVGIGMASESGIAVGGGGGILFVNTDGNWATANGGVLPDIATQSHAVSFVSGDTLAFGGGPGSQGIYVSFDGGQQWQLSDVGPFGPIERSGGVWLAARYANNDEPLYISPDLLHWSELGTAAPPFVNSDGQLTTIIRDLAVSPAGALAVNTGGSQVSVSLDAGLSWSIVHKVDLGSAENVTALTFDGDEHLLMGVSRVGVYRSSQPLEAMGTSRDFVPGLTGDNDLRVYPNPSTDALALTVDGLPDGPALISLFDSTGRTVRSEWKFVVGRRLRLETRGLSSGVYWIAAAGNHKIQTGSFVVL